MSLTAVVAALNSAITEADTIDLYAASGQSALADLRPVLARFGITSSFTVNAASLVPAATSATLIGQARWGLPGAPAANIVPVSVRLDCIGNDTVAFSLSLSIAQPAWTFGTSFAGLPETMMVRNQSVQPGPSFMSSVQVDGATFTGTSQTQTGLSFSGNLPLSPFWETWHALVSPWPLQISGAVVLPARFDDTPDIDLLASSPTSLIPLDNPLLDLSGMSLADLGFALISEPADPSSPEDTPDFTVLNLTGRLQVGGMVTRLSCPLLATGGLWHFLIEFEGTGSIVEGMSQLGKLFGLPSLPTPPDFLPIPNFRFDSIEFYVDPGQTLTDFRVTYVAATIKSTQPWDVPVPFTTLDEVGISWVWGASPIRGKQTGWLAASVFGTVVFDTTDPIHIDCAVSIPGWSVLANLRDGDVIPIGEAFRNYFGNPGPSTPGDMNIVGLSVDADPQEQSYYASADIIFGQPPALSLEYQTDGTVMLMEDDDPPVQGWQIDLGVTSVTLRELNFEIGLVGGELSGGIAATFLFEDGGTPGAPEPPAFMLSALYPGPRESHPEGWTFEGDLLPGASINLTAMVSRFLGQTTVPTWVPELTIDRLYFSFNSGTPSAYSFGGTISTRWEPTIFDTQLKISAATALDMAKPGDSETASGKLTGMFAINKLALSAGMTLGVPEQTYQFRVNFDDLWFQAVTSWRGEQEERYQVISLQLGGVTIGEILEYLVNLAAPTVGYSLDPPWDVLNRIDLSYFTLTLDPKKSTVELVYAANADLVFMQLDTIGVTYTRGENAGVSLTLTGSLLGQRFDGDDLEWDVIDGAPPELPGAADAFIRLRYLGLGQRVQLTKVPDTVAETLALLQTELKEPEAGKNPLDGQGVQWSAQSQWLIGLDVTLLDTVDLGVIFNDPWIYGLSIALGGEEAGSLAGLRFEILYKKVSDSVGMFRIELSLPEAFRHLEFGEVSVTLGTVVIEIYTNGNFKIDLGFPYERSFERSFSVEVFPFLGRGGIYFGLLDGTTSRSVPKVTNGAFSPVIELGVGLAVGVGKDVTVGPLSGGVYVQVEVIFEGVLGWFHPEAAGGPVSVYYRAEGVAAIHGKLYGKVDFKVIKVSVTLEAYAAAMVTLEAYRPTIFALEVAVTAEAEVKIFFIKVSFSFDVDLNVSFTVGSERPTPWILATDQSGDALGDASARLLLLGADPVSRQLARQGARGRPRRRANPPRRRPDRRRAALLRHHSARLQADALARGTEFDGGTEALNWQPGKLVFADAPRSAQVFFIPSFTVGDVPLSWTEAAPQKGSTDYRFAMQLFAPNGVSTQARTVAQAKRRSAGFGVHARDEDDLDALATDILIQGLLRYALYAIPAGPQSPTDTVTAGQLAWLSDMLDDPQATGPGFTDEALSQFFGANIHLALSGLPSESGVEDQGAMAMAVPPFLGWTSAQTGPVDFHKDNKIGPLYLWGVQRAAALFSPSGTPPPGPPEDPLADYVSFASHLFGDWCLLIARTAVREAAAQLDARELPAASPTDTLTSIANSLATAEIAYAVRPGDTIDTVADALGATVEELTYLNPALAAALRSAPAGSTIHVTIGVSPEVLALDNPTVALKKTGLVLGDLMIPVTAGDTLNGLGQRYNSTPSAIMAVSGQAVDAKLLAAGALFDAPETSWTAAPTGCTALRAAAIFYVRYTDVPVGATAAAEAAAWYAQVLADLNAAILQTLAIDPRTQELPPGISLAIPQAYHNAAAAADGYVTVPGDTLARIGAALDLEQNAATTPGSSGWPGFRDSVTAITGGFSIPAFPAIGLAARETLASLARRTVVNWTSDQGSPPVWSADWPGLAGWVGDSAILAPLGLITVPDVTTDATTQYSFASLAAAFALSLTDLGARVATVPGLVEGAVLTVKHLPADTVQSLLDRVATEATASISAEASRMLASGQEIPVPVTGSDNHVSASPTDVGPLFDQSRQQWSLTVDAEDPTGIALSLTLTAQVDWIQLFDTTVVAEAEDEGALRARVPEAFVAQTNRALTAGRIPPAGAVIHRAEIDEIGYSVTNQEVIDAVPVTALAWTPHRGPGALPVKGESPVTYGLSAHIALQSAVPLPVPGFDVTANTVSIHPFPAALAARAAEATSKRYMVYAGLTDTTTDTPFANSTFVASIGFTVRRVPETPGVYELVGADVEQVGLLLQLVEYLSDPASPTGTVAHIAVRPAVTAADPQGLALTGCNAWLIKSNLSTVTVPLGGTAFVALAEGADLPLVRADLLTPRDFALLLWEGTTVGGVGYTFGIDGGLGDGSFDVSDEATLQLVVIVGAQQDAAPAGRALLPFNTGVIAVDQGIADGATLFAEAHESTDPVDFVAQALLPAGSAGFELTLTRPLTESGQDAFRQSYSLVTAISAISQSCPYAIPASGLPAAPQASDGTDLAAWQRARLPRAAATQDDDPKPYWAYQTVLPVYRFGPASVAPEVSGLPSPTDDPYRGLGGATQAPQVNFQLGFGDVQGNRTLSADDRPVPVDMGYTDPLLGPTTWPAVSARYAISKPAADVILSIAFAAKAQSLMPSVSQRGDAMGQAAQRQRDQYATIYYQYAQPGMTIQASTTLATGAALDLDGAQGLQGFAAGSYLVASVAAQYGPVRPDPATLGAVKSLYGVGWDMLAAVNLDVPLSAIFGDDVPITVPAYRVMASGESPQSIANSPSPGWPQPTAGAILSAEQNKADIPLKEGAVLSYPARQVTLPATAPVLATVAKSEATRAGYLAADSAADPILSPNFAFSVDGVTVTVGQTAVPGGVGTVATFADAVAAFADLGIHLTTYDLGESHASDPGMLIPAATAHCAHYVVTGEATLAQNPSGAATDDLIAANLATPNLYEAGALIYLGDFGSGSPATLTPAPGDLLGGFAGRYACPAAALLKANGGLTTIAQTALAIPGAIALPAADDLLVPYTLRAQDTLSGIAAGFALSDAPDKATDLARRNRDMPGTVTQGLTFDVDVDGTQVPVDTTGLTSFAAVLANVQTTAPAATMAEVAAAFETPGRLAPGGVLVCPAVKLASATKPSEISGLYGVRGTAFGLANAGVLDLLVPALSLVAPNPSIADVVTTAHDTLNSVLGRFNALYVAAGLPATATVETLIDANADQVLFQASATALLPPADITLSTPLTPAYPAAAFPLTVEISVARPAALVHADFTGTSAELARASVAAPATGASMNFDGFEQALTAALPDLRLATAHLPDHAADLWAVDFGATGITSVNVSPSVTFGSETLARMIALAPLYGQLVTRGGVSIAPLVDGSLDPAHAVSHDYQGIDVEIWAARFLLDFDRVLAPGTAAAINAIPALRTTFQTLMSTKSTLQQAIPQDLAGVFLTNPDSGPALPRAVTDPKLSAGLSEARRVYGQALGASLSSAWETAAIVQYDATVDSAWSRQVDPDGTAAFFGEGRVSHSGTPPGPDQSWRLEAGKLDLSETAPFLTLPLSVTDPGAQSHVALDLVYTVTNLEIHRKPVAVEPHYTASDWLAMTPVLSGDEIPAALDVDLGQSDVPIPLKAFPALPLIVSQTGNGDPTQPQTLATAALWDFEVVYAHEHAAQDHVLLTADINLSPPAPIQAFIGETDDLFTALAQYTAVADDLNALLAALGDPKSTADAATVQAAVATFATLAGGIATLWNVRLPNSQENPSGGDDWIPAASVPFSAVLDTASGALASYVLTRLDSGSADFDWPVVAAKTVDGGWITLVGQSPDGQSRTYLPRDGTPILLPSTRSFRIGWAGLNVGEFQNARVRVEVVRNADLLGPTGPATAPVFVYRTATVTATDIVTPAITRTDPIDITGATFETALQSAFDTLFPPATRPSDLKLTFGLFYGYTLVPGPDPLVSELAVGLVPDTTLDVGTAGTIAAALQRWETSVKPNTEGGRWIVSVILYSAYDPGKRVLLSLDRLSYGLQ
ncbi:hypothetical protein [Aestuariivita sp.]|jgi:LysM repeat protein|uniref:hypothetical protein n=1 Tax=Aestuariivita sp. TaxID=1872407 RepID=UPI0021739588|nr:hypothetical protein [Aestuariivita sp.]MCE8005941.1 hypothetical protein [Aestuariivita sp.]